MTSTELLGMLNQALAREMQVSLQYILQEITWSGVKGFDVKDELKKIAITEMRHAEKVGERLFFLGGVPTNKPDPVTVGKTLKEMISQDIKDEESAVKLYKQIITQADKELDVTTSFIAKQVLEDEEGHLDTLSTLLEDFV